MREQVETAGDTALELRNISRRFGDTVAVDDVSLAVRRGTVHALLGENGAGKTTLMRIAFGLIAADRGHVRVLGRDAGAVHDVRAAVRAGVGMVQQHLSLVPNLTAAENLVLGGRGRLDPGTAAATLHQVSAAAGLAVPASALARDLTIVEQQRLEILKALARGARLLILDEPTAVLAPQEVRELTRWIRAFVSGGGTVVLITHRLREALAIADDVTVLRRGRVVHGGRAADLTEDALGRAMFPEIPEYERAPVEVAPGDEVARAEQLTIADAAGVVRINAASFRIRRHEIVGIAAVEGSGHRALLAALSGRLAAHAGTLQLPSDIALIPADRVRDAVIPQFDLAENVALRGAGQRRGRMPWQEIRNRTTHLIREFAIAAPSVSAPVRTLSGGNQQRLVIARELEHDVPLVVADNPTRGLDMRATIFVHDQLRHAAVRGSAIVVHSSDLDEVLALATRVLVVYDGRVFDGTGGRDDIGRAMLGVM